MIEIEYGDYLEISPPGLDGNKWRYPIRLRKAMPAPERDLLLEIQLDVVITRNFITGLMQNGGDLERVVFAMIRKRADTSLTTPDPPERIDITLSSREIPEARSIDPSKVTAAAERRFFLEDLSSNSRQRKKESGPLVQTTAFISYSWQDEAHKVWVKGLASRLRRDGVDVTFDRWHSLPGDALPEFMERAVRENQYVLIICSPHYKARSDGRIGGVGYEGDIMTGEVFTTRKLRKFIPVLREGDWVRSLPSWLEGKYGIDLRGDPYSQDQYQDLLTTLLGTREQAPPVGAPPEAVGSQDRNLGEKGAASFEPLRILGVVVDEVGSPRNDGTRGCALYEVPFLLSAFPPAGWAELFVEAWNHPPQFTTMHRPGTARVYGNKVVLQRTTMEEVEQIHRATLNLALGIANRDYRQLVAERERLAREEAQREEEHRTRVKGIAERLKFE